MDKVKVSKRVAEDIESVKEYGFDTILEIHIGKEWANNYSREFKSLESFELAKALINGYEIEETSEEKMHKEILNDYNDSVKSSKLEEERSYHRGYFKGHADGIFDTLEKQNIKIKGINS